MKTDAALRYALDRDLDLVEVAPEARPPVCRVLDYSKYKYEQAQKLKQARKHQQQITIREIKFRPKIAENDYRTKKGHVERFLRHKDKVKITIMFRGREVTHPERGVMILDRLAEELVDLAVVEQRPLQDGRNMTMMLGPSKAVLSGEIASGTAAEIAEAEAEAARGRRARRDSARRRGHRARRRRHSARRGERLQRRRRHRPKRRADPLGLSGRAARPVAARTGCPRRVTGVTVSTALSKQVRAAIRSERHRAGTRPARGPVLY